STFKRAALHQRPGSQFFVERGPSVHTGPLPGVTRQRLEHRAFETIRTSDCGRSAHPCASFHRLGRSLSDLLNTIQHLEACGVDLYLDQQAIDTTTPIGKLVFQLTGALASVRHNLQYSGSLKCSGSTAERRRRGPGLSRAY